MSKAITINDEIQVLHGQAMAVVDLLTDVSDVEHSTIRVTADLLLSLLTQAEEKTGELYDIAKDKVTHIK